MNKLDLYNKIYSFDHDDLFYFVSVIVVDTKAIVNFFYYATSLTQLKQSLLQDGEYFIITCWCGVPECAGIDRGIKVSHLQNTVKWTMIQPQRQEFIFSHDDYQTSMIEGIKQIKQDLATYTDKHKKLELVPNEQEYFSI